MSECALLLAGGRGRRMGRPKALLRLGRETLVEWQVRRLLGQGIDRVCVVVSPLIQDRVRRVLAHEPRGSIRIVLQPHPEAPPFDSLRRGLRAVLRKPNRPKAIWVLPVDVPAPGPRVFSRLRRALKSPRVRAALPTWRSRGGHPVLLDVRLALRLARLDLRQANARLDVQLHLLRPGVVRRVACGDPAVHLNVNTPGKWARFLRRER